MQTTYATPQDIGNWMSLVNQIRQNFPGLETQEGLDDYKATVLKFIDKRQAICVKPDAPSDQRIAGIMLFSRGKNVICCLGVSPVFRRRGVASLLMEEALLNLDQSKEISVSTFRAEDEKGTAQRALYEKYGFVPEALIREFGYPNQRLIRYPQGAEKGERQKAVNKMVRAVTDILSDCKPSIYLYGSSVLDDFRLGWSDLDLLVLTGKMISEEQARRLVRLRQTMLVEEAGNPYYRSFEGGMLTLDAFLSGEEDRVVYWGTGGERITCRYGLDAFCMSELLDDGILLCGNDIRDRLPRPAPDDLGAGVRKHYETIRKYAQKTGRSLYSFGWLLDISRCIYTLRTGGIISKTAAGEWALRENLCSCADALQKAVEVRKMPAAYQKDESIFDYAQDLGSSVQRYADILERELGKSGR